MSAPYFGDLKNTALISQLSAWNAQTTTNSATGVDQILGDGNNTSAILAVVVYDIASGNETYAIKIEESDDNSTNWTSVAGLDGANFTSKTSAGGDPGTAYVQTINFFRTKRYLRATLTVGGTTPSFTATVLAISRLRITGSGAGYQA